MLHVDVAVGPVSVMFSGAKEPIAAAGQTAVFGKLAVARQGTAPPETYKRRLFVGRCRDVEIEVCFWKLTPLWDLLSSRRRDSSSTSDNWSTATDTAVLVSEWVVRVMTSRTPKMASHITACSCRCLSRALEPWLRSSQTCKHLRRTSRAGSVWALSPPLAW